MKSVVNALNYIGKEAVITRDKNLLLGADKVILPGIGNFGDAMNKLKHYQLIDVIKEIVARKTPFLGICLGMQLLFERSDESVGIEGLSLLKGEILRIPDSEGLKIPHMGWNSLSINPEKKLYKGIPDGSYVYFVHSYFLKARDENDVAASTFYSTLIHASVEKDNIFGCQFHPEKSGDIGLEILQNFAAL